VPDPERTAPFDPVERENFRVQIADWAAAPSERVVINKESGHWAWMPKEAARDA